MANPPNGTLNGTPNGSPSDSLNGSPNGSLNGSPSGTQVPVLTSTIHHNTTLPSSVQDRVAAALISTSAPRRIEAAMRDELDRAAYTDRIRARATHLFRSGQAKTHKEAMDIIIREIRQAQEAKGSASNGQHANGANGSVAANGAASGVSSGTLNGDEPMGPVPEAALAAGEAVARKELESVVDVQVDDE